MQTDIAKVPIKPIKTRAEDKYSVRLLSREMSLSNSSSEVYYGDASVSIPFRWESQPGTPKVKFTERQLPPLTPPPSYLSSSPVPAKKYLKKNSKSNILHTVFPKLNQRKNQLLSSPASSSLSWSSSSSSSSSPWSSSRSVPSSPFNQKSRGQDTLSSARLSFDSRAEEVDCESPVSTLCFGKGRSSNARSCGYSARVIKLLLGESI